MGRSSSAVPQSFEKRFTARPRTMAPGALPGFRLVRAQANEHYAFETWRADRPRRIAIATLREQLRAGDGFGYVIEAGARRAG